MVDENVYMEDQPAGWESYNTAHSSSYSNPPIIYTQQSSSMSSFPNTQPQFGSYTNPHQPQFTFTPTNVPSSIRGRTLQQEPNPQGYQPGSITRGIFANALESVQPARRRMRRSQPTPVATHSDREERREYAPRSKTNDDKGLMDQVRDAGVVTDLQDNEIQEETVEVIDELLFKLRQVTEDRDRLVAQLRTAKRKHVIPTEEKEQLPSKRIDRGPRTMGTFQITPTSSMGIGQGSQLLISIPPSAPPSSGEPPHDNRDIVMGESPVAAPRREYEEPVEVVPVGELQWDDEPPRPTEPTITLEQEDPFGLDESDESEPETKRKKGKGKKKSAIESQREHALAVAGPIPPFWRIRLSAAGFPERDNAFRHMLDRGLYASRYDNNVYAGQTAYQAADIEENRRRSCGPPAGHVVYQRVAYGMPMTGMDVDRLIAMAYDHRVNPRHRGEAFMLLREFHRIASRVVPEYRDTAMQHIMGGKFNPQKPPKIDTKYLQMYWVIRYTGEQGNSGMKMPDVANVLHVDIMGLYILLHGRPGRNFFSGVVIDHAFRVNRRSVFRYGLGRIMMPRGREPHFRRLFACLLALPRRYREAIVKYNRRHPEEPFSEQHGPTYSLRRPRLITGAAANTTMQDIIDVLLDNRIPPAWIDHGYVYGLNFINFNIANPTYRELLDTMDNERHARLRAYGVPPAIPEWDGWRYPSNADIARLYNILDGEGQTAGNDFRNLRGWAVVGTTGIFEYLDDRRREEAQGFARSHLIHLPAFPELGDTPHHPLFSSVDHTTIPITSAIDHTTALELGEENMDMGTGTDAPPLTEHTAPTDASPA
jgi:hypothetical protein